jgi:gamma-glutamyl:cysteine ligase YbdK (ATP-grasp superfamily)
VLSTNLFGKAGNGYKSFRTKGFDKFPRTGLPEYFDSVASYDNFPDTLKKPTVSTTLRKYGGIYVYIPFMTRSKVFVT